jgi:hypothetical protein
MFRSVDVQLVRGKLRFSRRLKSVVGCTSRRYGDVRNAGAPSDLLEQFLKLRSDAQFLSFASLFGPLCLFPTRHGPRPMPYRMWSNSEPKFHDEDLGDWRELVGAFHTLLEMAALVRGAPRPKARPRDLFGGNFQAWRSSPSREKRIWAPRLFEWRFQDFVAWCGLRPAIKMGRTPELVFQDSLATVEARAGLSLFGALTAQTMTAAFGQGIALCSACGGRFTPKRRPAFGRRRYCSKCRDAGAPLRDAKAAWRAGESKPRKSGAKRPGTVSASATRAAR